MDLSSSSHEGIVAFSRQLNEIPRNNISGAIEKLAQSPKISIANLLVIFKFMSIFGKSNEFFLNFKEHISSEKQKLNLAKLTINRGKVLCYLILVIPPIKGSS